ncbi:non-ribosomal peptide synthetase [Leeia aquatica]|uniref:Amino acid adenylation domain-containing protein n=1 Tax=Leeia aquatica TaxID=2725557 RepID=A0A847SBZ7_9NEIS|nr:non-ribosomal peptide synthetase [Leeia aquatica]NLR76425.1 amino acid adenylation domain-containing protein [Leeia aquatica]
MGATVEGLQALLTCVQQQGGRVEVVDGNLRLKAPKGALSADLLAELKQHKADLLAYLQAGVRDKTGSPELLVAPLSAAQRQLWVLDQLAPGNPVYNNPLAFRLKGPLDRAALARAVRHVVQRHTILRSVFQLAPSGEPQQQVQACPAELLTVVDGATLAVAHREQEAQRLAEQDALTGFDLAQGPVFRSSLYCFAADDHVWLLNVHHIAADGWSMGILLDELMLSYAAFRQDQLPSLPALPIQYADHARQQNQMLQGETLQALLHYWTDLLHDAPAILPLPTDHPRPPVQRFRGGSLKLDADPALLPALQQLARQANTTLFTVMMAAFSVLLWRYSAQTDLCIGTPFASRDKQELEPLIGHFINPLVMRSRIEPERSFMYLLEQMRAQVLAAYAHQELPFDRLVEALKPERHTSYAPLVQVMLAMQNMPGSAAEMTELQFTPIRAGTASAKFDLSLEVMTSANGLRVHWEYDSDLFEAATIARMGQHFFNVLQAVVQTPQRPLAYLQVLSEAEQHRQLHEWNATQQPLSGAADLVSRFEAVARQYPAQLAVSSAHGTLDYATLDHQANRLAHALRARGIKAGQWVGLCLERSPDLLIGILGVLKAGAAYLPMDPSLPLERLELLRDDAQPALVLQEEQGPALGGTLLPELLATTPCEHALGDPVQPEQPAYVIYTSGSTGRPKGVVVPHRAVVNLLDHWLRRIGSPPGLAGSLWSSIGFDVSVHEIMLPLMSGGCLHLVPEAVRTDPALLLDWMRLQRIQQAYLPPAFVRWIMDAPEVRLQGLALTQLLVGVEPLSEVGLYRMQQALPGLQILNGYGPTETTVYSCAYHPVQALDRRCPIGRPLDNTQVYLLDAWQNPVPVGVAGEIHIAGRGLALGYLGDEAQTAAVFVKDPFAGEAGARMYRTGDYARYLPDGHIEFLGRQDNQVKVRGYRIELGEVEAALRADPLVREAVVLTEQDAAGEVQLLAAIVAQGEAGSHSPVEWRSRLAQRVPAHMVPSLIATVAELPMSSNGKLDRAKVLALIKASASKQVNLASPRDHVEFGLYEIWRSLLLQPHIGIRDNFFDVGGTSVSAIKLSHAIEARFGKSLPLRDILLHPTIEAQGGRLRAAETAVAASSLITFRTGAAGPKLVCIHPAGGTAFCYLSLAKALPESYGVYGIQSPGVEVGGAFLPTVEAMADTYLEMLGGLTDQPLILTGLSYGGLIAYQMACQLAQTGKRDVTVLLLDTQGLAQAEDRAAVETVSLDVFRSKLVKFNGMYPGIDDQQIEQYFRIYNHHLLTMRDYVAPACPVRVVLVQAMGGKSRPELHEVRQYWLERVAAHDWRVKLVHGDHWDMLESAEVRRVTVVLLQEWSRLAQGGVSQPRQLQQHTSEVN